MISEKDFQLHKNDTGSTAVQIILLREKIKREKSHLAKENKKDHAALRALLKNVAIEKKLFEYLKKNNPIICEKLKKEII